MKYCIGIILLVMIKLVADISAQTIYITASEPTDDSAELFSVEGESFHFVDSVYKLNGIYSFNLSNNSVGFYKIKFSTKKWLDFIYDGKDIRINTKINAVYDSIEVIESESNKLYYQFLDLNKSYSIKTDLLQMIIARYPPDDDYYKQTKIRLSELQSEYMQFVNGTSQSDAGSLIARYIRSSRLPVIDSSVQAKKYLEHLKKSALDYIDFNDAELIYSDCFTNKSIEYLTYFRNPQLPKELLEKEFLKAVDTLLIKASVNILVYQHIADYLVDGFKKFGFDNVVDYIVENYVVKDDLCLDEETENSIQNRINQSKLLSIGVIAPDFEITDHTGRSIRLSGIKAEKTLLFFYSVNCPHCQNMIPELADLYVKQKNKKTEVIAVSLDEDISEWKKYSESISAGWLNVCDGQGWNSPSARKYFIYATPAMFLLDKDREILDKPLNIEQLKRWF